MRGTVECQISEYSDYFSHWWGLKDGTLLSVDDLRGSFWVKLGDDTMTVEEFNAGQHEQNS